MLAVNASIQGISATRLKKWMCNLCSKEPVIRILHGVMHASIIARSMDCIAIISKLRKMFVARSIGGCAIDIDWCANHRSIVRAEQSMDSANLSTARNTLA